MDLEGMITPFDETRALTSAGNDAKFRTLGVNRPGRPAHALANLGRIHTQLAEGAAEGVAMHAELFGGLALVAAMARQDLKDEALLELAHRVHVRHSCGLHSQNKMVQLALHSRFLAYR